jgi:hypothetical protein
MPKGSLSVGKSAPLHKYLDGRYADAVVLTFAEIEDLAGFALPDLARLNNDWWAAPPETAGGGPTAYGVSSEACLQLDRAARSETLPCPICGRPLRSTVAHWLAAFECDRCGQFSDFGGASSSPAQSGGSPLPKRLVGPSGAKP